MDVLRFMICLMLSFPVAQAFADPTVTFSPATNDNGTPSGYATIQFVSNKWNISITKNYSGLDSLFTITVGAGEDEPIRFIQINQGAYSTTNRVEVRGRTQYLSCGSIERLRLPDRIRSRSSCCA